MAEQTLPSRCIPGQRHCQRNLSYPWPLLGLTQEHLPQAVFLVLAHGMIVSKGCVPWVNTKMGGPQTYWKPGLSHVLKTQKMHTKGSTMCTSCCSLVPPPTTKACPIKFNRPLPGSCCLLQFSGEPTRDSQGISRNSVESLSHHICNSRGFSKNFFKALMHSFTSQSFDSVGLLHKAQQARVVLLAPEPTTLAAFLNPSFKFF